MMKFAELQIAGPVLRALDDIKYIQPTPIQKEAIPIVLSGQDILGTAQTGTGKTGAFAIPIIDRLHRNKNDTRDRRNPRSLIITPTRELAIQIGESIAEYSKFIELSCVTIFGGVNQSKQVAKLERRCDILVATPGRLLDLIQQGIVNLEAIEVFVLDEADRMLDMGFIRDIRTIIDYLPARRQSLFFSATMPKSISQLASKILKDPIGVDIERTSQAADSVDQFVYFTNRLLKKQLILHIFDEVKEERVLVFTRTKRGADNLARFLSKQKISSAAIHGNKAQTTRQRTLNQFKEGKIKILIATDIAARGIDINELGLVINFDIPNVPETYVHRIGRSGRAGLRGKSFSICETEHNEFLFDIEKLIGHKITVVEGHPFLQTDKPMTASEKKALNKKKQQQKMAYFSRKRFSPVSS